MFGRLKESTGTCTFQFTWSTLSLRFLHNTLHNTPNWECSSGWNCKCTSVDLCPVFLDGDRVFSSLLLRVPLLCYVVVPWLLNLCHFGSESSPNETSKYCYSGLLITLVCWSFWFLMGAWCVPRLLFFYHDLRPCLFRLFTRLSIIIVLRIHICSFEDIMWHPFICYGLQLHLCVGRLKHSLIDPSGHLNPVLTQQFHSSGQIL